MTRYELLANSARLVLTAVVVSLPLVVVLGGFWRPTHQLEEHLAALVAAAASGLLAFSLLCAAAYHAARGLFRPLSYQPPSETQLCAQERALVRKPWVRAVCGVLGLTSAGLAIACFVAATVDPLLYQLGGSAVFFAVLLLSIGFAGRLPRRLRR